MKNNIPGRNRIAIFGGATEGIWSCVKGGINLFKAEIVCFVDSDSYKQGLVFHRIPVIAPNRIEFFKVDYILIAAHSAMESITSSLLELGIEIERIAPFITDGILSFNLGNIEETGWRDSLKFYIDSENRREIIETYIDQYRNYINMRPFERDKLQWNNGKHLIAHAGGGFVNGIPCMYTNSKEALEDTIDNSYQLVECDVMRMPDGEWMLAHSEEELFDAWEYGYSPLSLNGLLLAISKSELTCLLDVKWENYQDYRDIISYVNEWLLENDIFEIKTRIIFEAYDEETIKAAVSEGFEVFFTQYRNSDRHNYMKIALLCEKYGIRVVGFGMYEMMKHIRIFTDKGIDVYKFSTDDPNEYSVFRSQGGYGVFTNFLTEKEF